MMRKKKKKKKKKKRTTKKSALRAHAVHGTECRYSTRGAGYIRGSGGLGLAGGKYGRSTG
jgi:hypothetical protein